jgi:hypothetical protein
MTKSNEPAPAPRVRPREPSVRILIKVAALSTTVGIALAVAGDNDIARWFVVVGLSLLVVGLHRFGRLGSDAPIDLSSSDARATRTQG